ncbi:MAG TPA: metal-dependent hydrolase [Natrialbaceae archaeon]|nr:metal-dependent hydrolase [Natrialbaceae archaeon]
MYRTGHYGAALLAYAPIAFVIVAWGLQTLALVGGLLAVGLATLPDYDQRVPFVEHRGPTHTVWFVLLVAIPLGVIGGLAGRSAGLATTLGLAAFGFLVGVVAIGSHVAADALTPAGVRPFAPLDSRKYTYSVTKAKNPVANYLLLALGAVAVAGAFVLGNGLADAVP